MPPLVDLPLDQQLAEFERSILTNPVNRTILQRVPELDLPNWRLTAGCLFQTVWNEIGGFEPTYGIRDYGLFYFDGGDLSWEAEDEVIRRCAAALAVDADLFGPAAKAGAKLRHRRAALDLSERRPLRALGCLAAFLLARARGR